jgi:hypothetical protein
MVGFFRFGQEEMHMLGHDHISDDDNSVAASCFFEDAGTCYVWERSEGQDALSATPEAEST